MATPTNSINFSLAQTGHLVGKFFHRFHIIVFVLLSLGGLIAATFLMFRLVNQSEARTDTSAPNITFNQTTIDKLKRLQTSSEDINPDNVPKGKRNPFAE